MRATGTPARNPESSPRRPSRRAATRGSQPRATAGGPGGSLVDVAYATMRRRILDNAWPPGLRALEQELAQELGMSRTPVREALIRLRKEGLVEVVPRHGMRVLPVSPPTCATSTRC